MPIPFNFEDRRDQGGWGAYETGSVPLSQEQRNSLYGHFSTTVRLNDLPGGLPWAGALELSSGPWVVVWHSPGERRLRGLLLTPEEWGEVAGDLEKLVTQADDKFAETYLRSGCAMEESWLEPLQGLPEHPLGESCVDYLPLAFAFLKQAGRNAQQRNHSCATSWRKGLPRPDGLNVCPFAVTERGPGTLEAVLASLRSAGALVSSPPSSSTGALHQELEDRYKALRERLDSLESRQDSAHRSVSDLASRVDSALRERLDSLENRQVSTHRSVLDLASSVDKALREHLDSLESRQDSAHRSVSDLASSVEKTKRTLQSITIALGNTSKSLTRSRRAVAFLLGFVLLASAASAMFALRTRSLVNDAEGGYRKAREAAEGAQTALATATGQVSTIIGLVEQGSNAVREAVTYRENAAQAAQATHEHVKAAARHTITFEAIVAAAQTNAAAASNAARIANGEYRKAREAAEGAQAAFATATGLVSIIVGLKEQGSNAVREAVTHRDNAAQAAREHLQAAASNTITFQAIVAAAHTNAAAASNAATIAANASNQATNLFKQISDLKDQAARRSGRIPPFTPSPETRGSPDPTGGRP